MRAGTLTRRVEFQRAVTTQDGNGDPVPSWTSLTLAWASIEPLRGREALIDAGIRAEMDTRIIVRWSSTLNDISAADRIVAEHTGTVYNIVSVAELRMEHRELEILAKAGLNNG